jgi:PAS domain-containing protein
MDVAPSEAAPGESDAPGLTGAGRADEALARATEELGAAASELQQAVERADRAEEALASVEALADALLACIDRAVIVLDTDLRVVGWSTGAETTWSRSAADAVGRRWSRLGRGVDPAAAASQLDDMLLDGAPGAMVPFGESLQVQLVGEGEVVRYLVVTQADT